MQITLRNCMATDKIHDLESEKRKIEDNALLEARDLTNDENLAVNEINNKISYINNHANRTYTAPFIEFEMYKEFYALQNIGQSSGNDAETMARFATFVCNIFGNQFTEEQFCRGVDIAKISETMLGIYSDVSKMINEGVKQDTQY